MRRFHMPSKKAERAAQRGYRIAKRLSEDARYDIGLLRAYARQLRGVEHLDEILEKDVPDPRMRAAMRRLIRPMLAEPDAKPTEVVLGADPAEERADVR